MAEAISSKLASFSHQLHLFGDKQILRSCENFILAAAKCCLYFFKNGVLWVNDYHLSSATMQEVWRFCVEIAEVSCALPTHVFVLTVEGHLHRFALPEMKKETEKY